MLLFIRRRNILGILAALSTPVMPALAADHVEAVLRDDVPASRPEGRVWVSPPNCYFTYPHSNGFLPNGNPVLGRLGGSDGRDLTLLEWDFRADKTSPLYTTRSNNMYWEVAERTGELVAMQDRSRVVAVPTATAGKAEVLVQIDATPSYRIEDLISVNTAADKVLYAVEKSENDPKNIRAAELFEIDRRSGVSTSLGELPFNANHQHYCPADERWIGFSHEGEIRWSLDRMWALNRSLDGGRPHQMWDEAVSDGGVAYVGHERWAFHRAGAFAVAYPSSPGHPRGLYFVDPAAKRGILVSASDYDWHCNASRDGKWAVVDTFQPPHRKTESDGRGISDIVLVNVSTGRRQWLARSHRELMHPWHPHPHFSPDGKLVIYNDFQHDGAGQASRTVIMEIPV